MRLQTGRAKTQICGGLKGLFFSVDAILAVLLLFAGLFVLSKITVQSPDTRQLDAYAQDLLAGLGEIRVYELAAPWVQAEIRNGNITNLNNTVLFQIGEYWATNKTEKAQNLSALLVGNLTPYFKGVRLTFDGEEVYNDTRAAPYAGRKDALAQTFMVSGVTKGKLTRGFTSSAYLRRIRNKRTSQHVYFGGFVGQGNITAFLEKLPSDINTSGAINLTLELDAEAPFDFYINNLSCARFSPSQPPLVPDIFFAPNCSGQLAPGRNDFDLKFPGDLNVSYVAGGFIKVAYMTEEFQEPSTYGTARYWFPGIMGAINLYDAFYVPGTVANMTISLHFFSNYSSYLTLGSFGYTFPGSNLTQTITLNSSNLSDLFNQSNQTLQNLSLKTVPLRFGLGQILLTEVPADVVLVTDTSGSMEWCTNQTEQECFSNCAGCSNCSSGGGWCGSQGCIHSTCAAGDVKKVNASREAALSFIETILNNTGPRVGLVEFATGIKSNVTLTNVSGALRSSVLNYTAVGGTCICCGINAAAALLAADSQDILIVRQAYNWRYNDSNMPAPLPNWNNLSFNDSSWGLGRAALGRNLAGLNTLIRRYTGDYYFRKKFNVTDPSQYADLRLFVYENDGADVYLNGVRIDANYPNTSTAMYWTRNNIDVNESLLAAGENIIAARMRNNGGSTGFDLELIANKAGNITGTQRKAIVVMTDGQANYECAQQGTTGDLNNDSLTDRPEDDAVQAACDARNNRSIEVHAVGFGRDADAPTLQALASCGGGQYYNASNLSSLVSTYETIASVLIQNSATQKVLVIGNYSTTILYPDSYIEINYTPTYFPPQPNEISLTFQTEHFNGTCSPNFTIPTELRLTEAVLTSYSGDHWTSLVRSNGQVAFNLSDYADYFTSLGDPYNVHLPLGLLQPGTNSLYYETGDSLYNATNCSSFNSVVYKAFLNSSTARIPIVEENAGCNWTVEFADGALLNLSLPAGYDGPRQCNYTNASVTYSANDAYDAAVYRLFRSLDFDNSGRVFVNFAAEDLEIIVAVVAKVPFFWGPSLVQAEVWR